MPDFNGGSDAVVVAVYAALTYDVISATNSSPQTTEINAQARAETLMKWVHIGLAQAAIFAVIGVGLSKGKRWPPALGSGLAGIMLYAQYVHAKQSGLAKPGPATEEYG
jgi:membrane protein required for beta-lactamase induction